MLARWVACVGLAWALGGCAPGPAWGEEVPANTPFVLATATGEPVDFAAPVPPLQPVPEVDPEALFALVQGCFPAPSKFDLSVKLRAGADLTERTPLSFTNGTLQGGSRYFVGIVAEMPLWDNSETTDRQRQREYQRRLDLGQQVATFIAALTERNTAKRKLGLYLALEQRSQQRVGLGLAPVTEQVDYLEKVIETKEALTKALAQVTQARLALVGHCAAEAAPAISRRLAVLADQATVP